MIEEADTASPLGPSARPLRGLAAGVARLCFGLGAGLLGLEAYHWGRFGVAGGPLLADVLRGGGWRLPRTSWVGLERVLEWALGQSVFVLAGACCLVVAGIAGAFRRERPVAGTTWREALPSLDDAPSADVPGPELPAAAALPVTVRILRAYSALDRRVARVEAAPAKPGGKP